MNYAETIDYLFSTLPMFSRIGSAAYKKDLTNTIALCDALGNPQKKFACIHVAGTNGKGSVSHMLAAALQTAGYKTGLYTSPHLQDFRERIKVNGEMCSEEFVCSFVAENKKLIEDVKPSFFEITVAMAFDYFAKQAVDIAVIEVGLGGRLDSTNIITPVLSVITNIGFDHMNMLGDTLPAIAFEKAGIIKKKVPVVVGEANAETRKVFEAKAIEEGAALTFAEEECYVNSFDLDNDHLSAEIVSRRVSDAEHYKLDLTGLYQLKNLCTVITAVHQLNENGWQVSRTVLKQALQHTRRLTGLRGRWQVAGNKPLVVMDVAHNIDGINQLLLQLEHYTYDRLHIVTGMVNDKDVNAVLTRLPRHAVYYFTNAAIPRAMPAEELAQLGRQHGLAGKNYKSVAEAFHAAKTSASPNDMVLVCGSVFIVGEALSG